MRRGDAQRRVPCARPTPRAHDGKTDARPQRADMMRDTGLLAPYACACSTASCPTITPELEFHKTTIVDVTRVPHLVAHGAMLSSRSRVTRVAHGSGGLRAVSRECQLLGVRALRVSTPALDIRTDGGGEAEDFIERSLDQASKQGAKKRDLTPGEVLTTKREALSLYRAVYRASFMFVWKNERGVEWKEVIRESARKEFEAARQESDPEMVARLLLTGRDYLDQAVQKFLEKRQTIIDDENKNEGSGGAGGVGS